MMRSESLTTKLQHYDAVRYTKALREIPDKDRAATFTPVGAMNVELQGYPGYRGTLRQTLIEEETDEVVDALHMDDPAALLKELCDLVYVAVGTATAFGMDFDTAFNRVHEDNMRRLALGTYREDGKLVKPDDYPKLNLDDCV